MSDDYIKRVKGAKITSHGSCADTGCDHVIIECTDGAVGYGHARPMENGEALQPGESLLRMQDGKVVDGYHRPANGPSQVASPQYRHNYDAIFGKKSKKSKKELN